MDSFLFKTYIGLIKTFCYYLPLCKIYCFRGDKMYSSNIKTIRACNGMLFVFYYSQGSIFFAKIHKGSSSAPVKIADNASPMFSVWCTDNGIYIMFNGDQGTVLCFYNYSRWVSRIIAKDLGESCSRISFLRTENPCFALQYQKY